MNKVDALTEVEQAELITGLIKCYPASQAKVRIAGFSARSGASLIDLDNIRAVVDGPNVVGMLEGMTRRNKKVALNTYRFAEIMASNRYPGKNQMEERFQFLLQVLTSLKWTKIVQVSKEYEKKTQSLTMENVVVDIVGGIVKGAVGGIGIPSLVSDTLGSLKQDEKALNLFNRSVEKDKGRRFGMASCVQDNEGYVNMAVAAVNYSKEPGNDGGVLFFEWKSSEVNIYQDTAHMVIHEGDYPAKREEEVNTYLDKLDERAFQAILAGK
ncbi:MULTISPECIES: hypothetical protein [Pseudomonas]|jgi:hypothetical protein|uniref:Uncharacterized protein n=2 Tax=Pseudomonas TaxID=286 RepID=A0ACC5MH18_9PSED|nr:MULTISPECIES: hypothetical protein [Pseudomonas]ATE79886.1 hypothetical protein CNN82_27070 [Pseudomonas frederiksbergensis]MBB2888003.1 hypothetical protein [Pseudomonas umsongensis]NMN79449.1 hypothetical protein [Pseudomonas sp. KD5]CAH0308856.1 hypothetical protein SRABI123_04855 [Pseudomonas sp. Bi123]